MSLLREPQNDLHKLKLIIDQRFPEIRISITLFNDIMGDCFGEGRMSVLNGHTFEPVTVRSILTTGFYGTLGETKILVTNKLNAESIQIWSHAWSPPIKLSDFNLEDFERVLNLRSLW